MNEIEIAINRLAIKTSAIVKKNHDDYFKDDLLYCGKCNSPKECKLVFCGGIKKFPCLCNCAEENYMDEKRKRKESERNLYIESLRMNGIKDKKIQTFSFDNAIKTPIIQQCMKYVENWKTIKTQNSGLIFWGGVGSGKTFAAGCIANALIDKSVPVLVTSFPRILNSGWDKSDIIDKIKIYDLMIIDDLGAERESDYSLETVYLVIDERIKSQKPLIITTNLTLKELNNPENMVYWRIYDRILSNCKPVFFPGGSKREKVSNKADCLVNEIFGG